MKDKKDIEQLAREYAGLNKEVDSEERYYANTKQISMYDGFIKGYELAQQSQSASIQQAVELSLRIASEEAWLTYHDGTTKSNNHGNKQINIGANHIKIDPISITSLLPKVLEQLNVSDGWISVDILPNKNDLGFYLCYLIEVNDLGISKYQDLVWFNGLNFDNTSVSHYQPLPSPPQLK